MSRQPFPPRRSWARRHPVLAFLASLLAVLIAAGGTFAWQLQASALPDRLNMGSDAMTHDHAMAHDHMGGMAARTKTFHLTAVATTLDLGGGQTVDAWTFDGTTPGPELRVQQEDQVVVELTNRLPVDVTIHWHGVEVPNSADGVAGLTQDAIRPGESYTYRFVARDAGTFWYHTHQEASIGVPKGLYGVLIVEPKSPTIAYDRDYTVTLHEWTLPRWWLPRCHPPFPACSMILDIDGHRDGVHLEARPGERVRLRILDAGEHQHLPALVGAPFRVIALDGRDLHEPQELRDVRLPLGAAQRYDLDFVMPAGPVALIDADPRANPAGQRPAVTLGAGPDVHALARSLSYPEEAPRFDFTSYGTPAPADITRDTPIDAEYSLDLGSQLGFYNGEFVRRFTINGDVFPAIPEIRVRPGEVVKIHFSDTGDLSGQGHPMHLHGHTFTVLAMNGRPLGGSPIQLDTVMVWPGETYDVAFRADNPGLWMLHCHIGSHAAQGMDTMVVYPRRGILMLQDPTSKPFSQTDSPIQSAEQPIRVLLADDHPILRSGLRLLLSAEPDLEVVGEANNGLEAVEQTQLVKPDVVVMDIAMPGMSGLEATRRIGQLETGTRVLILTVHAEEQYLLPVVQAGGSGYVLKSQADTDLLEAIRAVHRGEVFLDPPAQKMLLEDYLDRVKAGKEIDSYQTLSEREREVLKLTAEGYTAQEIADRLVLSPKTVDTYRQRVMDKLNLHHRAELVKYALRKGLLQPDDR